MVPGADSGENGSSKGGSSRLIWYGTAMRKLTTMGMVGLWYQKYTHVEKLKLLKDLTDAMEKHQKELIEQVEKHQRELADALANQELERAHRKRLEDQLASQQLRLAQFEQVEKELRDAAQPQRQLEVLSPNIYQRRSTLIYQ